MTIEVTPAQAKFFRDIDPNTFEVFQQLAWAYTDEKKDLGPGYMAIDDLDMSINGEPTCTGPVIYKRSITRLQIETAVLDLSGAGVAQVECIDRQRFCYGLTEVGMEIADMSGADWDRMVA